MEVFLAALVLVGFGVLGMCFNIIFRKNGQFPQTDVGNGSGATCSGTYSDSCIGCGLYPPEKKAEKKGQSPIL